MRSIFRHSALYVILISIGCVIAGCLAVPRVKTPLFEGPQGAIALQVFAEPKKRAQHPVSVEPHLIRGVLKGLYVQETQTSLESALITNNPLAQAFTEREIHFLTPHLIDGLAKATPEEEIVFRLHSRQSQKTLYTTGALYYADATIHVIIHGYHTASQRSPLLSRPSNSFSRPKMWKMAFLLNRALTSDSLGAASQTSFPFHFAINLPLLTQTLRNNVHPTSPTSPSIHEELEGLRESLQQQHQQIDRLENQLQTPPPSQPQE